MATNLINTTFLSEYKPANWLFTSKEEMEKINRVLPVDNDFRMTLEDYAKNGSYNYLQMVRDQVVEFYSEKMRKEVRNSDEEKSLIEAMQSVTGVIDHYIYYNF